MPAIHVICDAPSEPTEQRLLDVVRDVLRQRPQAVCLFVVNPDIVGSSIDSIAAQQALVVTMGRRCNDPRIYGCVSVDLGDAAEQLGEQLPTIAAGRKSYVLVHESGRNDAATRCYQRFMATARPELNITLLKDINTAQDGQDPADAVETLLKLFPHAGLLVTLNPDVWVKPRVNWNRRLHALNGGFRFVTLSAVPVLWPMLGAPAAPGDAAALAGPIDGDIGYAAVEIAAHALLGTGQSPTQRTVPCELVTPQTLPDFARRYAAAANGLNVTPYLPQPPAHETFTQPASPAPTSR